MAVHVGIKSADHARFPLVVYIRHFACFSRGGIVLFTITKGFHSSGVCGVMLVLLGCTPRRMGALRADQQPVLVAAEMTPSQL